MKVALVSNSDTQGGAARASFRLMSALVCNGTDCSMIVKRKQSDNIYVIDSSSKWRKFHGLLTQKASSIFSRLQNSSSFALHSLNIFGSDVTYLIDQVEPSLINLHWVNFETLSIRQISKLKQPVVMTLHDMWAFCGTEHLAKDDPNSAFRLGYVDGRSDYISGINWNKLIWKMKKRYWKTPFHIVAPSNWMATCARESALFNGWDVSVIPNPLDTNVFKPLCQEFSRELFNLPQDKKIIGFGAFGGAGDPNKGFDLLEQALKSLTNIENYHCVVFGQSQPNSQTNLPIETTYLGHLSDDVTLSVMYNTLDVMVIPSRQENLPQTATEAIACGVPVTAFATSGLFDVVEHKVTGFLAKSFDTSVLASGIKWCIDNNSDGRLSINARERALKLWSQDVVAAQYMRLFEKVIAQDRNHHYG